jgi:hypothetical protein
MPAAPASVVMMAINVEHWVRARKALTTSCSLLAEVITGRRRGVNHNEATGSVR